MSSSSPPNSPRRSRNDSNNNNNNNPRFFDKLAKNVCWAKADTVPGRHPERWQKDAAGNIVCKRFCNCQGWLCFEYDHIVSFSKGGESTADNCQILQIRVNRFKSDKEEVDKSRLRGYSCDILFTGMAASNTYTIFYLVSMIQSVVKICVCYLAQFSFSYVALFKFQELACC